MLPPSQMQGRGSHHSDNPKCFQSEIYPNDIIVNCQLCITTFLLLLAPLKALQCYIHPIHVVLSYFQIDKSYAYGASTHVLLLYDVSPNIPRRDGGSVSYMVGSINNGQWAVTIRACIRHLHTPTSLRWI